MEKIEFLAGDEKRFNDFISNLDEKDKIALISHSRDIDGIVSAKIIHKVVDANFIKFVDYEEVNDDLILELKKNKINKTIISDLSVYENDFIEKLQKFSDVLIIDHHVFSRDLNSERVVFLNTREYCAAYICYYLFSKRKDLDAYDWLAAIASVSDWLYHKNNDWIEGVYEKYKDEFILEDGRVRQKGKMWDLLTKINLSILYFKDNARKVFDSLGDSFAEIGDLGRYSEEVQKEVDKSVEKFSKEKEEINGRYFWSFKPRFLIGSLISSIISSDNKDKTFLIIEDRGERYHIHGRRQDCKENMSVLIRRLVEGLEYAGGGGHIPAGGGHFLKKDFEKFMKRVREI